MRKATLRDTDLITDILTDSFKDNKSIINVTRKGKNQLNRIRLLMKFFFLNAFYNGDTYVSDDNKACLLMLTNDVERKHPLSVKLLFFFWKVNLTFNILGLTNLVNVLQREKAINKNHPKKSFLHLYYVGVYKKYQGNGIGTKLINQVINSYSGYDIVYLETSDKRNLPLYDKLGFDVVNVHDELEITLYILKKKL